MKHGFIKTGAVTPKVVVADCVYNADRIIEHIDEAEKKRVKILLFPELCVTGYTCGDLFLQDSLLKSALKELCRITAFTKGKDILVTVGLPISFKGNLYNVACVIQGGRVLGMVPKVHVPNYTEFYEGRYFSQGKEEIEFLNVGQMLKEEGIEETGMDFIPFGTNLLFSCKNHPSLVIGVEICEDLWVPLSPGVYHALAGATILLNLSASNEVIGKASIRRELVKSYSGKLVCGYVYADVGNGESSTDMVFSGHNMIAENGHLLKEAAPFENGMIVSEIDVERLIHERRRKTTFLDVNSKHYANIEFVFDDKTDNEAKETLARNISKSPFVPEGTSIRSERCEHIIKIQAHGLRKRLEHIGVKNVVIGVSGGLDSTLALLVICRAFDLLELDRKGIIAVTMPCFGTTDRTYQNALKLASSLNTTLLEIPIKEAVLVHFRDIGHDKDVHDLTYENSQARERTQVLMDVASKYNGLVVGTGDMSELALGWATYNGDHMSMYGVNASVPKTLVKYLVEHCGITTDDKELSKVLMDIVNTPVSPELLPPVDGVISQVTEDIVGPYELHDFFLYYMIRFGFSPSKIYYLAKTAFSGVYEVEVILKWMKVFYRRFFSQQYKRSCIPDGPKVGSVSLSPRGDLRMPSDASANVWLREIEELERNK